MNDTLDSDTPPISTDFDKNVAYVTVGTIGMSINILTMSVLISHRKLLLRSAVMMGIAVANFSVSLHILGLGAYRLGTSHLSVDEAEAYHCALTFFPLLHPFSYVGEGLFVCLGGLERVLAINASMWFRKTWTPRTAWRLTTIAYLMVTIYVSVGIGLTFYQPTITWSCSHSAMFGSTYQLISYTISACGGALGACSAVIALITGVCRVRKTTLIDGEAGRMRKQLRLTKSMSLVAVMDLGLISVPNMLAAARSLNPDIQLPEAIKGSNVNFTFSANALVMVVAMTAFNKDFRQALLKLIRMQKIIDAVKHIFGKKTLVQPMNTHTQVASR